MSSTGGVARGRLTVERKHWRKVGTFCTVLFAACLSRANHLEARRTPLRVLQEALTV